MEAEDEDVVSGSVVSLEEELALIRASGYWWRPGQEERKTSGELTFSHDEEGATLRLFGSPESCEGFNGFVRGWLHPTRNVTLLHCQEYRRNTSSGFGLRTETAELGFIEAWIGDIGFDSVSDIAFESYSFGITNLSAWIDRGCFHRKLKDVETGDAVKIEMHRLIFEDGLVRVYLAFIPVKSLLKGSRGQGFHRYEPSLVIKSKVGRLPFYGDTGSFEYYENRLTAFFGLLIGKNSSRYGRCGMAEYQLTEADKDQGVVWRLNRRPLSRKLLEPLERGRVFVPYAYIEEGLPDVIENFFKLNDEVSSICGRLVYFRSRQESIPYGGVPELVFMFEGLARNLYDGDWRQVREQLPGYHEHVANVAKVNGFLKSDAALLGWLTRRLQFKPVKIQELFDFARMQMAEAFFKLEDESAWMAFTRYLRARRDGFAHSESKICGHDDMNLAAYFWLESFMMGMVLLKCGVPAQCIRQGVARLPDFRWGVETYCDEFCKKDIGANK